MKKTLFLIVAAAAGLTLAGCSTTNQRLNDLSRFNAADTNHDGKLSQTEATNYFVSTIFNARDANHDGKLSWEEWNVPGSGRTKAKFDAADTNKDGVVSGEEATARADKIHLYESDFREADTNHDGYLTKQEITAYRASKEGPVN